MASAIASKIAMRASSLIHGFRTGGKRGASSGNFSAMASAILYLVAVPSLVNVRMTREPAGRSGPHWLAIAVEDDGEGIPPEHLPRLTERFYRVSVSASREKGGTGLGLAIVKHIVTRHRGELKIASTLGTGSTFTVLLDELAPSAAPT